MKQITPYSIPYKDLGIYHRLPLAVQAVQIDEDFEVITTKDEKLIGKKGDCFVCGTAGCIYPVDKQIFEDTYRKYHS